MTVALRCTLLCAPPEVFPGSLRGTLCEFLELKKKNACSLVAPVAIGQLWDSRRSKPATIHPLQSLFAPLPGAKTGPCKCSLVWQTHPLHLHGTSYKAPWDKVSFPFFLLLSQSGFIRFGDPFGIGLECCSSNPWSDNHHQFFPERQTLTFCVCVLQRELKVSLLWYTSETRLPAQ